MNYKPLSIEDFGRQLILTQDLDPIYVGLHGAEFDPVTRDRWLLVYWCCYDAGVSSYIAEAPTVDEFWGRMERMALNITPTPFGTRWRRAAERRHWRGRNAETSLAALRDCYDGFPEEMARYCAGIYFRSTEQTSCAEVMKRAQRHAGFGPWIGFKIADMIDRCMEIPVSFEEAEVFVFKDPALAAEMAWMAWNPEISEKIEQSTGVAPNLIVTGKKARKAMIGEAVERLTREFSDLQAPPDLDRPIRLPEIETVLCKWKSHVNGRYPVGKDTIEIRHHLQPWLEHSNLARRFLDAMPK